MSIQKTAVEEEVLSKQERAILRSILRINYLVEGIVALDKSKEVLETQHAQCASAEVLRTHTSSVRSYLANQALMVLESVKVPGSSSSKEEAPQPSTSRDWMGKAIAPPY